MKLSNHWKVFLRLYAFMSHGVSLSDHILRKGTIVCFRWCVSVLLSYLCGCLFLFVLYCNMKRYHKTNEWMLQSSHSNHYRFLICLLIWDWKSVGLWTEDQLLEGFLHTVPHCDWYWCKSRFLTECWWRILWTSSSVVGASGYSSCSCAPCYVYL